MVYIFFYAPIVVLVIFSFNDNENVSIWTEPSLRWYGEVFQEEQVMATVNSLGVGPMGFGGGTTLIGCKVGVQNRLPASYFVSIAYDCWAFRRLGVLLDPQTGAIREWQFRDPAQAAIPMVAGAVKLAPFSGVSMATAGMWFAPAAAAAASTLSRPPDTTRPAHCGSGSALLMIAVRIWL